MRDIIKVAGVVFLGGHRLRIAFSNGSEGERDFADVIAEGSVMVQPLADERFFARVLIELGTLAWPNGFDVNSIALHDKMQAAGLLQRRVA
jgi:hypothetical protein